MKVRSIKTFPLRYPEPNDFGAERMTMLVRVDTDAGIIGWGEAIAMWPEACRAVKALIEGGLDQIVIGRDPTEPEPIWSDMKAHCWWYGLAGIASFAISGIDIALWDIAGKATGQPLYKLLGGKMQQRLPACASTHPSRKTHEENADELAGYVAQGFQSVKFGFGKKGHAGLGRDPDHDVAFVAAVRRALGDGPGLMIDVGNAVNWDVATAVRTVRRFEEYRPDWIEEPLHPDDWHGLAELRAKTSTSIAHGEREWGVEGYRRLVDAGFVDVFGIDPGRAEGVTGFRKIAEFVGARRRHVNAHAWSSAVITAASLHLSVATPWSKLFEFKPLRNPMQHELVEKPIDPVDGWAVPPEAPGLGIDIVEDVVRHYAA